MQVKIYSTTTCPYCKMLKDFLKERGIVYEEKMVDHDKEAKEQMVKESEGFMGVPFVVITKDNGTKENVVGFDKGKLDEILGIT